MNFLESLKYEEQHVIDAVNVSCMELNCKETYLGPTKIWMYEVERKTNIIPTKELDLLRAWKAMDEARYSKRTQLNLDF
jgi:hypothetical protein